MTDLSQTLKAGTLLVIETGIYSDRCWEGPFRVKRDFTKQEAADAFRASFTPGSGRWDHKTPQADTFGAWLVKNGYVEDAGDSHSWHVGDGDFDPTFSSW